MTSSAPEHFGDKIATDETIPEQRASAIAPPGAIDLDELIGELDVAFDYFPEEALRACQANRELVTPRLIEVLQEAVRAGQQGEVRDGNAPIFALFLLAEFEAMEALPVVMDFVKLPGGIPETLMGDAITEDLPRFLALFAGDRSELLDDLIRDRQVNEWVRWEAINALIYLVRDGRLTRETAIERLTRHLVHAMGEKDKWITGPLILALLKLNANETRSEMERAYREHLVDESLVGMESVDEALRPDQPGISNDLECYSSTKISDTVAEMRNWVWSEEDDGEEHDDGEEYNDDGEVDDDWLMPEAVVDPAALVRELAGDDYSSPYEPYTIRSNAAHVGRNDPCPCGSGKKYKKCCLRS